MVDVIAFDADDTLWHNERMFQATEAQFAELLAAYHPAEWVRERLFATEMKNLGHFGYGIKGFILSMIETALDLTESRITGAEVRRIVDWGHFMLQHPVQLLDGVRETIEALNGSYRLMLLTKGDLFDQESKLARSGLGEFFDAVEIVSAKNAATYRTILTRHAIAPERFFFHRTHKIVAIGVDDPLLPRQLIDHAFALLDSCEYVLGPAEDGGYYLLGCRALSFEPSVFQDIAWGTSSVLSSTIGRIAATGRTMALLPERFDIDTAADLERFAAAEHDGELGRLLREGVKR